jgi:hypothetical protein
VCWLKVTDTRQDHKPGPLFNFSANGHKASDGGKPTPGRKVSLVSATGIVSDKPVWAMEYGGIGCIQRGSFALWAGRPGAGKSTAARWLAAGYSLGIIEGCWHGQPQNVAYLAPSEESLTYTIKPGLIAAGADISRICFPHVHAEDKVVQLRSLIDEEALTEQLLAADVSVVVVDPVMATIGSKVDINRNNEVRTFIEVWPRIATAIDGIVTGIAHLVKAPGGDIVAAINGSSAFGEVARAIFGFAKDPNSEQDHRIMSQEKNSTGREDLALTYAIESQEITTDTNKSAEVGKFVILGNSERTVSDLLRDGMEKHTVNKEATDWLSDYLTASGRTASKVVKKAAKNDGDFSERTIQRAASDLKVVSTSEGFPRVTYWHLPGLEDGADLCMRCGKPMLLGQTGVHLTCSKTERDDAQ